MAATDDFSTGQSTGRPIARWPFGSLIGLSLPSSSLPITRMPAGPGTRLRRWWRSTPPPGLIVLHVRRPFCAIVSYAWAMSSAVTPCLRPPSVMAKLLETGVRIPIRRASLAIFFVPVWTPSCA